MIRQRMSFQHKYLFLLMSIGICIIAYYSMITGMDAYRKYVCRSLFFYTSKDSTVCIHPFYSDGRYVTVIPSTWALDEVRVRFVDKEIKGEVKDADKLMVDIPTIVGDFEFFFFQSELPCVFINTESGSMEKINSSRDKSIKESGEMSVLTSDGVMQYRGLLKSIHGRGNSTWKSAIKKPYNINTGKKVSLLGMRRGKKYCLLTGNSDRSNARDYIALLFAKKLGFDNAVDCRYVSLYLNGDYHGVCILTNKVEQSKQSDFFIERGGFDGFNGFVSKRELAWRILFPKQPSVEERDNIKRTFDEADDAICSATGYHEESNKCFLEYVDVVSFAKHYLLQEFLYNIDLGNFYLYHVSDSCGGKLYASSIWDFSASMGKNKLKGIYSFPEVFFVKCGFANYPEGYLGTFGELFKFEEFRKTVDSIFQYQLYPEAKEWLNGYEFKKFEHTLTEENKVDQMRWRGEIYGDASYIKRFLNKRLEFMYKEMIEKPQDEVSVFANPCDYRDKTRNAFEFRVKRGAFFVLPPMPGRKFRGWYDEKGNNVSSGFVVRDSTRIHGKYFTWF